MQPTKGHEKIIRGVIRNVLTEPRSYTVESEGRKYRRNCRHLLPVEEPFLHQTQTELEDLLSDLSFVPDSNIVSTDTVHAKENIVVELTVPKLPYCTRYGQISKPNPKYNV